MITNAHVVSFVFIPSTIPRADTTQMTLIFKKLSPLKAITCSSYQVIINVFSLSVVVTVAPPPTGPPLLPSF